MERYLIFFLLRSLEDDHFRKCRSLIFIHFTSQFSVEITWFFFVSSVVVYHLYHVWLFFFYLPPFTHIFFIVYSCVKQSKKSFRKEKEHAAHRECIELCERIILCCLNWGYVDHTICGYVDCHRFKVACLTFDFKIRSTIS